MYSLGFSGEGVEARLEYPPVARPVSLESGRVDVPTYDQNLPAF